jgi:hypothetical protein
MILEGLNTSDKIRALIAVNKVNRNAVSAHLEITPETLRDRLDNNRWKSTDLQKLAVLFKIDVRDLI